MKKINFKEIAKDVIETEIKSLKKLKSNINKSFDKAVDAILSCKNGKIILSGVGKSGIIGKKISSTFASVGISKKKKYKDGKVEVEVTFDGYAPPNEEGDFNVFEYEDKFKVSWKLTDEVR